MLRGYAAVAIGSEMSGDVRNVVVKDCVFKNIGTGFNIKSRKGRGGVVENITVSNIEMHSVKAPIAIYMNYRFNAGDLIAGPKGIPTFRNITITDINIHESAMMGVIKGIKESPITGLTLKNIKCNKNGANLSLDHVKDLDFDTIQNGDGSIALKLGYVELK